MNSISLSDFFKAAELIAAGNELKKINVFKPQDYPSYTPEVHFIMNVTAPDAKPAKYKKVKSVRLKLLKALKKLEPRAISFRFVDSGLDLQAAFAGESDSTFGI